MEEGKRRTERELAELAALADGSLPPDRRRALEDEIARSPRLQALLREQQAAIAAVRARHERAPQRLREAIGSTQRARRRRTVRAAAAAITVVAALAALVLVLLPASEPASPTLTQVAALADRQPTVAGPVSAWGLEYPDLSREYRFRESGSRTDRLRDRTARTVFYVKDGRRIAYTIVSTGTVRVPKGTHSWLREGKPWYAFALGGRNVVAWERKGHMCVVSASGLSGRALVRLITS